MSHTTTFSHEAGQTVYRRMPRLTRFPSAPIDQRWRLRQGLATSGYTSTAKAFHEQRHCLACPPHTQSLIIECDLCGDGPWVTGLPAGVLTDQWPVGMGGTGPYCIERSTHPICSLCCSRSPAQPSNAGSSRFSKVPKSHFSSLCASRRRPSSQCNCAAYAVVGAYRGGGGAAAGVGAARRAARRYAG
jgi:hypothetical protein